jgi:serine/threonine protein kinase
MGLHRDDSAKPGNAGQEAGEGSDLSRELTAATPSPGTGSRRAPASSIAPGTTFDHFEILELLGAGGFGEVYRARDTRLERAVAIKVLSEDFAQLPFLRHLGAPEKDKKHVLYDSSHFGLPQRELIRESLDWLDKYLGPVKR